MKELEGADTATAAEHFETLAGLERALDASYRRFVSSAAEKWERSFGGKDPSDACVTVRIATPATSSVRTAGFLPQPESSRLTGSRHLPFPRLAR